MTAVLVLLILFVLLAALVAGGVLLARFGFGRVKGNFERSNQVVPGIASSAPTSWLGSHDPEAKLHRRLQTAIRSLHAGQNLDLVGDYLDLRVEIERQAVAIDEELVATSALPVHLVDDRLAALGEAVATLEEAVAEIGLAASTGASHQVNDLLAEVRRRSGSLDRAEAALREIEEDGDESPADTEDSGATDTESPTGNDGASPTE